MPNRADEWMNLLQVSGYRQTHARRAIVEILLAAECALEPMEIFEAGRRQAPRLGLVTVYRTLEKLEALEQLRALEYGYRIKVVETVYDSVEVDTREELERVISLMEKGTTSE